MLKQCIANHPKKGREGAFYPPGPEVFPVALYAEASFREEREASNFVADWQAVQCQ